jgi:hypothetical protein
MLTDASHMPFGKYKGERMIDVPARYLHWLWTECGLCDDSTPVSDYIRRNLASLKLDYPDGIWD